MFTVIFDSTHVQLLCHRTTHGPTICQLSWVSWKNSFLLEVSVAVLFSGRLKEVHDLAGVCRLTLQRYLEI